MSDFSWLAFALICSLSLSAAVAPVSKLGNMVRKREEGGEKETQKNVPLLGRHAVYECAHFRPGFPGALQQGSLGNFSRIKEA